VGDRRLGNGAKGGGCDGTTDITGTVWGTPCTLSSCCLDCGEAGSAGSSASNEDSPCSANDSSGVISTCPLMSVSGSAILAGDGALELALELRSS